MGTGEFGEKNLGPNYVARAFLHRVIITYPNESEPKRCSLEGEPGAREKKLVIKSEIVEQLGERRP